MNLDVKQLASRVGVSLSDDTKLLKYISILDVWRHKINLVGNLSIEQLVEWHLIDSLVPSRLIETGLRVIDVGAGAGFPGIPLAILRPDATVVSIEPRQKRFAFLQTVRRELGLANFAAICARYQEVVKAPDFVLGDVAISRATFPLERWLRIGAMSIKPTGIVIGMEGATAAVKGDDLTRIPYQLGSRSRALIIRRVQAASDAE